MELRLLATDKLEQMMIDSTLAYRLHRRYRRYSDAMSAIHQLMQVSTVMYERLGRAHRREVRG